MNEVIPNPFEFENPVRALVPGNAEGDLVYSDLGLSFWGGVDPVSGSIIDRHHPLTGQVIAGKILAIPSGRGSSTGSSVILELILNDVAPAGLILAEPDEILTLGVLIASSMFGRSIPVMHVKAQDFKQLKNIKFVKFHDAHLYTVPSATDGSDVGDFMHIGVITQRDGSLTLSAQDEDMLQGVHGQAVKVAMEMIVKVAKIQGASELIDVSQAHIDACNYIGPASLLVADRLVEMGAKVCIPTTLNSISVDKRKWRELGVPPSFGEPASAVGDAYLAMGAKMTFTCAPYLLESAPNKGAQIAWAESNAVVFANSVLGARTLKYPDYLDTCIALTGRAPLTGSHADTGRHATIRIDVSRPKNADDSFYPLLGYQIGLMATTAIPVVHGLETAAPSLDDLKAFSAAFGTTSASPMFHISGVTPEASTIEIALAHQAPSKSLTVTQEDLVRSWKELDSASSPEVQLISLGNPHLSLNECNQLARLCAGRTKHSGTSLVITMGRDIHVKASEAGYVSALEVFGATFITDTCWCMLGEPVIHPETKTLMTNSAKYAHYAPGLVDREVHFGSLSDCINAACIGRHDRKLPAWLT